eukprot:TRINITY_DN10461_c0_g1_i4.p3 TRINITY_DN10461_c0_g1~~TRINITY_DN10461_c0_g1_i4.p3  ORF type:complete len:132 (-),score=17.89 TRINITY_DN10461_c0_g1_i4:821-1216(-)
MGSRSKLSHTSFARSRSCLENSVTMVDQLLQHFSCSFGRQRSKQRYAQGCSQGYQTHLIAWLINHLAEKLNQHAQRTVVGHLKQMLLCLPDIPLTQHVCCFGNATGSCPVEQGSSESQFQQPCYIMVGSVC